MVAHRLHPVRAQREHDASYTRAKRGHNAKNNVRITRNNAVVRGSIGAIGSGLGVVFRGVIPDRERNLEKQRPVLVNSARSGADWVLCYSEAEVQSAKVQGVVRAALVAIVVVLAQVQCVVACVGGACADASKREAMPPCHRHHQHSNDQDPASCAHQTLSSPGIQQQAVHVESPVFAALGAAASGTSAAILRDAWGNPPYPLNFSPPGTPGLSSVVLRI
jgi:hypothetical protein